MTQNTKVIYKNVPSGVPQVDRDFEIVKEELDLEQTGLKDSEVLVQNLWTSVDPYLRNLMRDPSSKSYFPSYKINKPMFSRAICKVVKVADSQFKPGDIVFVQCEWANYAVVNSKDCQRVENKYNFPLHYYLGVLGMPGLTAYVGLREIAKPKVGETIFVSGAAGAVGQLVGQLANLEGLRVVGCAGNDKKVKLLTEKLGYDAAFNYKTIKNLSQTLSELCPKGIDIYFDNVGGETLETVLLHCNNFARIPLCGMISQYNSGKDSYGVKNLMLAVTRRILLQGFIVGDHYAKYRTQFLQEMEEYIHQGKIISFETIEEGVENIPKAFLNLFHGHNIGKQVVKVSSDA